MSILVDPYLLQIQIYFNLLRCCDLPGVYFLKLFSDQHSNFRLVCLDAVGTTLRSQLSPPVEAGVVRPQGLQLRPKLDTLQEPMPGSEAGKDRLNGNGSAEKDDQLSNAGVP